MKSDCVFADICLLYELSLSIGESLDLHATCERFLGILMARKTLGYAAVWLHAAALGDSSGEVDAEALVLVHGIPRALQQGDALAAAPPVWRRAVASGPQSLRLDDPELQFLPREHVEGTGAYAVFALGELGFLEFWSQSRSESFGEVELAQLSTVVRKLGVFLEGAIAYGRNLEAIEGLRRSERERGRVEEELRQTQKMEAIGRLAGGVAHDFNNLLTSILGYAQLLHLDFGGDRRLTEGVTAILEASERAAELTGQLLSFSHRGQLTSVEFELDSVVDSMLRLLPRTLDPSTEISREGRIGDDMVVVGDPSRIETALLNLAVNALDAMPSGGCLTVATRLATLDEEVCRRIHPRLAAGSYAEIRVADTGVGMSPEVASRIFEPFFTTKEVGRGTGLGLAAVYGIVMSHEGAIDVASAPGAGTTFRVLLRARPRSEAAQPLDPEAVPDGDGVVLVVEDQHDVRTAVGQLVRRLGYEVVEAGDGLEALAMMDRLDPPVSAVLLDIRMPRMNGVATLRRLRRLGSAVPVVMMSAFGSEDDFAEVRDLGIDAVLVKPFTISDLGHALRQARTVPAS